MGEAVTTILKPIWRHCRRLAAAGAARVAARVVALARNRSGVTAVEYAIMAGLLATAIFISAPRIGMALSNSFSMVAQQL